MVVVHHVEKIFHVVHDLIELSKGIVVKVFVIFKTPLAAAPVMTPVVALSREIYPLRMAELVTHKVKVCLAAQCERDKTDHFM